ncbi:Heterokaryon incompatibility protein 6,OR allele [Lachnellula cervina]|uniref:Heterokaryon incompatibility protein 6,OR allele n=1 Tax=Lachnellula cervina TaxID=1316786 RepID=A0A7D8UN57_9HELO|nr:Heterokaryon incompatibility protein 6,OR allele [Lachnellula cervina]
MVKLDIDLERDVPELPGKVILITGGTNSLGAPTAKMLASRSPAKIYITGRNKPAAHYVIVDVKLTASIKTAANEISKESRLDILIANASIMALAPAKGSFAFALAALRGPKAQVLWVDALCINQKDLEERSAQVRQMADIYGKAWRVVVWLGRQSCRAHDVGNTLDQLRRHPPALRIPGPAQNIHDWSSLSVHESQDWVARLRNHFDIAVLAPQSQLEISWNNLRKSKEKTWNEDVFGNSPDGELGLCSVNRLMSLRRLENMCTLSYWHRLWIVQEILLARDIIICFGDNSNTDIGWDTITVAQDCLDRIPPTWSICTDNCFNLVKHSMMWYLARLRQSPRAIFSLTSLFAFTKKSLCKDPRDKIYGLLGILDSKFAPSIAIDYAVPLTNVYLGLIRWYSHTFTTSANPREFLEFGQAVRNTLIMQLAERKEATCDSSKDELDEDNICLCLDHFPTTGVQGGSILFTEEISDTLDVKDLARRIHTLLLCPASQDEIEKNISDLVTLQTSWLVPFSPRGYAQRQYSPTSSQPLEAKNQSPRRIVSPVIFALLNGDIGIGSNEVRNGDVLCWFLGFTYGVVLRQESEHFTLISKATTSVVLKTGFENKQFTSIDDLVTEVLGAGNEAGKGHVPSMGGEVFDITLDIPAYHDLVCPIVFAQTYETHASQHWAGSGGKTKSVSLIGDGGPQSVWRETAESTEAEETRKPYSGGLSMIDKILRYPSLSFEELSQLEIPLADY